MPVLGRSRAFSHLLHDSADVICAFMYPGLVGHLLPALGAGVVVERRGIAAKGNCARQVVTGPGERPALPTGGIAVGVVAIHGRSGLAHRMRLGIGRLVCAARLCGCVIVAAYIALARDVAGFVIPHG